MKTKIITMGAILLTAFFNFAQAQAIATSSAPSIIMPPSPEKLKAADSDLDGLNDYDELYIYHTNVGAADSDTDGYLDGDEVKNSYDPNKNGDDKLQKYINVSIENQTLRYGLGGYEIANILVSTGKSGWATPKGQFKVEKKRPLVDYIGAGYSYKNTKWNLLFKYQKGGNIYIHGAFWHNNFGRPMSHGCVNVSYADMEPLYEWADVGTAIVVQ